MEKQLFVTKLVTESSAYSATRPDAGDLEGVGTLRWIGDKLYRWVQNRHSAALAANDVVFHTFSDTSNAEKYVRDGATADLGFMAGVVASTAIAVGTSGASYVDGGYGWIQVLGSNAAVAVLPDGSTAMAAGHSLIGANGTLTAAYGTIMGTAPLHFKGLLLLEACASMQTPAATTKICWISCL